MVEILTNDYECMSCGENNKFKGVRKDEKTCTTCGSFGFYRYRIDGELEISYQKINIYLTKLDKK